MSSPPPCQPALTANRLKASLSLCMCMCVCVLGLLSFTINIFLVCLQKKVKRNKRVAALISCGRCENNQGEGEEAKEISETTDSKD